MKTQIEKNKVQRVFTTVIMSLMIFSAGNGQGLLAEGASHLVKSLFKAEAKTETAFILAEGVYSETENNRDNYKLSGFFSFMNDENEMVEVSIDSEVFHPMVISSYTVRNLDVSYENDVVVEEWMTESFTETIETAPMAESWMSESFSDSFESEVATEEWMTTSFYNEMEPAITVENWMTSPLVNESELVTEAWMFETFETTSLESQVEVEEWMTTPLYESAEEVLMTEAWMTKPLN